MVSANALRVPSKNGVITPGLPSLALGMERYVVPGRGSYAIELCKHDSLEIVSPQGLQPAELVFFSLAGESKASFIGLPSVGRPNGLMHTLKENLSNGSRVLRALKNADFDLYHAEAALLFAHESPAGDRAFIRAECDGLLIVCAPGESMVPYFQLTATPLEVFVQRNMIKDPLSPIVAAEPLASPLYDENIQPGEAHVYEVKAGQFIQIMDVQGRECSDFQAFSLRALDKGLEREIDPTATRSMTGQSYPTPGIVSKYWSSDLEPLLEVVQDTCGRHDTFGLACTARYYEDLGYPGHVNCTDNINKEMSAFGVRPRGGWPAINLFFNTLIDQTNVITMDDPWSRPGDYVLLRALTDLVCVSTACPCDIDPANGWNPTDIQIRLYKENESFKRSIAFRRSTEADMEQTEETAFHSCFAHHTRDFIEYNGFWLAQQMTVKGVLSEYWACREKAVVMDLSPLRKYEVTGPDAEALMQLCVTRDVKKLAVGQVVYTAMCYEHGGMIDDGTVFRLGDNNFRWIGGNDTSGEWLREQAVSRGLQAWVRDSTKQLCNIAIQGRLSRSILSPLFWTAPQQPTIEELPWFRFTVARLGGLDGPACVISRTGYTGELGYEVFCHPKDASVIFDKIWSAGEPVGLVPAGLGALDILRIESGLIFAGYDFDDQTDPFEAGIGFTVPLKRKADDFIGRSAIERRNQNPSRRFVGLDIQGGVVPQSGDCIRVGRAQIGQITSAVKSPMLGKVIALCRIDVTHAEIGTEVEVGQLDGHQKRLLATVVGLSHFDPKKLRAKGEYS